MEGVGARLGRSSTRYGPTPVFTGPVRKWKKKWVHVPPPNSNHHNHTAPNGTNSSTHLLLFKWTPAAPTQNKDSNNDINDTSNDNAESNQDDGVAEEEPPRRKFKYIPIVVLEEQNDELSEQMEDETKPIDSNTNNVDATSESEGYDEKPNMNDVPMDEYQDTKKNPVERQDLNVSTLDLSLGFNSDDGGNDSDPKE
ncbi:hypothetical protein OROGR_007033 [Orobanche gracilis]